LAQKYNQQKPCPTTQGISYKSQCIKFIPDVYQNKFVSEQAHDHLETLGEHNPITENRDLYYKIPETFDGT